jgi:hypothetical protein
MCGTERSAPALSVELPAAERESAVLAAEPERLGIGGLLWLPPDELPKSRSSAAIVAAPWSPADARRWDRAPVSRTGANYGAHRDTQAREYNRGARQAGHTRSPVHYESYRLPWPTVDPSMLSGCRRTLGPHPLSPSLCQTSSSRTRLAGDGLVVGAVPSTWRSLWHRATARTPAAAAVTEARLAAGEQWVEPFNCCRVISDPLRPRSVRRAAARSRK